MIKSVLTCCLVVAYLLLPASFNSALALNTSRHDTQNYTNELKPIPQEAFQIAKATFLPYIKDSEIGFSGNELKGDYNHNGDCTNKNSLFTHANCTYPKTLVPSSQCPFLPGYYTQCKCLPKFNKTSCDAPYVLGGDNCDGKYEKCVCPAKVELTCPNDTCTKTCEGNCISKSCTPTANQTGCTNGTQACDDGCCGTNRKCCVPCTDKITSKPANSSYTYSSCTDGEGSKQIQTGWVCDPGYHEQNGACEKDCQIDSCSAYPLTSCPTNGNCSTCNKTAQDCSIDSQTKYRLDSCASGYQVAGNECVKCNNTSCESKCYSDYEINKVYQGSLASKILSQCLYSCSQTCDTTCSVSNCVTCQSGSSTICAECQSGYQLYANKCYEKCKSGYIETMTNPCSGTYESYRTGYGIFCYKCTSGTTCNVENCAECVSGSTTSCKTCKSGYQLSSGKCVKKTCTNTCYYTLTSCPENGYCKSCTIVGSDCSVPSGNATRYSLVSCHNGTIMSGNKCIDNYDNCVKICNQMHNCTGMSGCNSALLQQCISSCSK